MKRTARLALVLPLLAACTQEPAPGAPGAGDGGIREAQQLRQQIAALERKIQLLEVQVGRPRVARASDEPVAAAQVADGDAQASIGAADPGAGTAAALANAAAAAPGVKAFLESDDGKKALAVAVRTVQEQAEQERAARMIEDRLAAFAKDANLTEDQVGKMRDILTRSSRAFRDTFAVLRDGGSDLPQAERDQARQQAMAKVTEIRKSMDDEARVVLSQTQFEQYQKAVAGAMGGFGFRGPGAPAGRGN
jgi:hypothetical protein